MNDKNDEILEGELFAGSIFGAKTRRGLVRLSYGITFDIQITPEEARAFAVTVFEAAEAAETDEFIATWVKDGIEVDDDYAVFGLLKDFREMREMMRKRDSPENRRWLLLKSLENKEGE